MDSTFGPAYGKLEEAMIKDGVKKGIVYAAGALLLFVGIAFLTVFLLSTLGVNQTKFDAAAASPAQLVEKYREDAHSEWGGFTEKNNQQAYVGFLRQSDNDEFEFEVSDFIVYDDAVTRRDINDAFKQASRWFERYKFQSVNKTDTYITYESALNLCQFSVLDDDGGAYGFACRTRESMINEIEDAKRLVSLYAKSEDSQAVLNSGSRVIVNYFDTPDQSIRYATISFSKASSETGGLPRLVFGSINGAWEYVANLNNPSSQNDGKRAVSEIDAVKLRDEKWKGYLSDVF